MVVRTCKGIVRILAGLGAGLAIIFMLLAWQLSKGPISLGFLSPYIENAVNQGQPNFQLKMRDTILAWAGWERTLDIRILDVEILNNQQEVIGSIPELTFALNRAALLKGEVAPSSVEIFGPRLRVIRQKNGSFNVGFGNAKDPSSAPTLTAFEDILDGPKGDHPLKYLSNLHIIGADLTIDDQILEKTWIAPSADIRLERDEIGVKGQMSLILDIDGNQTELELLGRYNNSEKQLEITADVDEITLAPFAPVFQEIEILKNFDVPLRGNIGVSIPITGGPQSIRFNVRGDSGKLQLPAPFKEMVNVESVAIVGTYDGASDQTEIEDIRVELAATEIQLPAPFTDPLYLKAMTLNGAYSGRTGVIEIKELSGDLDDNRPIYIPAPVDHKLPLRTFWLSGDYDSKQDTLSLSRFAADLQGPQVALTGTIKGALTDQQPIDIDIDMELSDVAVNDARKYWPKSLGVDPYNWVTTHLSEGTLHILRVKSAVRITDDGEPVITYANGTMQLSGVSVDYLPPLPKATGVNGEISFDNKTMDIKLSQGKTDGLTLKQGTVRLSGLDEKDQYAEIALTIDGSVQSKLAYIDNEPLGFASELGIDPKSASGKALTDLKMKFIIENDLRLDQVEIAAMSNLTDVTLDRVFLDRGIHDSALELNVNNKGMTVTGQVNFGAIPAKLVWHENFADNPMYQSRYDLFAEIKDVRRIGDLGIKMEPLYDDYLSGEIDANIRYTVFDDVDRRLEVRADVTNADLSAPAFGWSKRSGVAGLSEIIIDLERDEIVDIPKFSVKAADLTVKGSAKYASDGTGMERIEFDEIIYGRTDIKGALIPRKDGGWEVGIHGSSFDFSAYWDELFSGQADERTKEALLSNLTMAIEIDRIWINETQSMEQVSGTFSFQKDIWQTFLLSSQLDGGASLDISIQPGNNGDRQLSIRSDNAGDTLQFLDAYQSMRGGNLTITGVYDDKAPGHPLTGRMTVEDYRIVNAPALAHVLSIMALTGIVDALSGEGIGFSTLDVPFSYHQGVFKLKDARASGTSLGFTAAGHIYRNANVLDINGTVVPAYALNSALGRIPVLGSLLTGGEAGGGVFAANYSMTGSLEAPKVFVNPLSALTPGFLRNVFGIFSTPNPAPEFPSGNNLNIHTQ